MTLIRNARRLAAVLAGATLVAGLIVVQGASPASATRCTEILTAGPGPTAGSIVVTFEDTGGGPYTVEAFVKEWDRGRPTPYATPVGSPRGTELTGLEPSTAYWVDVLDGRCASDGRWVTSGAVTGTNLWMQAYGRASQQAPCDTGWWGSYAECPISGRGGWTCERYLAVYG